MRAVTRLAYAVAAALACAACFRWAPRVTHFRPVDGFISDRDTGLPVGGALVFVSYFAQNLVDGHSKYRTTWSASEADGSFTVSDAWRVTLPRLEGPGVLVAHPTYGCMDAFPDQSDPFPSSFPSSPLAVRLSVTDLDAVESCRMLCEQCKNVDVFSGAACGQFSARMCGPQAGLLPDGSARASGPRHGALREGRWTFFAAKDRVWATGGFWGGTPIGRWDFYEEDGSLIRTKTYCRGASAPCPSGPP